MISIHEFAQKAAAHKGRIILFIRHAERPPIDPADSTFGEKLMLTEEGFENSRKLGLALRAASAEPEKEWSFWASPLRRTILTAQTIAEQLVENSTVHPMPQVGIPGLWLPDVKSSHDFHVRVGAGPATDTLFHAGISPGYIPTSESTARASNLFRTFDFGSRLVLVISHDVFIAQFLQGLGIHRFDTSHWLGHLQGAAIFLPESATNSATPPHVEFCVPDPNNWLNCYN